MIDIIKKSNIDVDNEKTQDKNEDKQIKEE